MKDAAAAVTPSGVAPQGGFGDVNGGNGIMTNGQTAALGYSPDLKLPDGKRLAYRRVKSNIFSSFCLWIHCKKRFAVSPSPDGMSLYQTPTVAGNNLIIPGQGEFGK